MLRILPDDGPYPAAVDFEFTQRRPGQGPTQRDRRSRPSGSRASLTADVRTAGLWSLLGPVIRGAIRREDAGRLEALERALARS